ncbi:MAG: hypothetical protein AB1925_04075 [Actinomycetota bacterium]
MKFNPPPTWPQFPPDWSPTPDWTPDPTWPPAPPGWTFWTEDEGGDQDLRRRPFVRRIPWGLGLLALATAAVVGIMSVLAVTQQFHIKTLEQTATVQHTFVLRPDPHDIYTDFTAWRRFGDIDVVASPDGRSAAVASLAGETDWSGVQLPGGHTCAATIAGRVRDGSHTPGEPGGYGFGLAEVNGPPESPTLAGSAVQYDVERGGYRVTHYPSHIDSSFAPAPFDRDWHAFELTIDKSGTVVHRVDGAEVLRTSIAPVCGYPVIRVWGGSAVIADLDVIVGAY